MIKNIISSVTLTTLEDRLRILIRLDTFSKSEFLNSELIIINVNYTAIDNKTAGMHIFLKIRKY